MSENLFGKKWTMGRALSSFSVGWNPDAEQRLYEPVGDGYKLTVTGTANGKPYEWGYTAQYDGRDHAVHGRADADSIEAHFVNDRITIGTFKKAGRPIAFYKRTVSLDGRSLLVEMGGRSPDGGTYYHIVGYQVNS